MPTYPSTLPSPQTITIAGNERRAGGGATGLATPLLRARQTEYVAQVELVFPPFSPSTCNAFWRWWLDDLEQGGMWFYAPSWPRAAGYGMQFRFTGPQRWMHQARGWQQIRAQAEMRGLRT